MALLCDAAPLRFLCHIPLLMPRCYKLVVRVVAPVFTPLQGVTTAERNQRYIRAMFKG